MNKTEIDLVCLPKDCFSTLLDGEELAAIAHAVDTLAAAFATDSGEPALGAIPEYLDRLSEAAERSATALEAIAASMNSKGGN